MPMDQSTSERMFRAILAAMDCDNAHDLEKFGRNFLHNGKVWDMLADQFPTARASDVRGAMMRAFEAFQRGHAHHH